MAEKPRLTRNMLTYIGFGITVISFTIGIVLVLSEILLQNRNPYSAVVTYMIVPAVLVCGLILALVGVLLTWRQRKLTGMTRPFPVVDLNRPQTTRRLFIVTVVLTGFFGVSAVATYRGFIYTESVEFCGTTCHTVMGPEYTAYQSSPHARVSCVECHIGSGATWYMRSKVSGIRQVVRTLLDSYELPIQVPIETLRPARETCEHCHWPQVFSGSVERIQWHFWYDDENTPSVYHMLLRVGGVNPATGRTEGIHWHINDEEIVRYWPRDRQRLDIPWVEIEHSDGTTTVHRTEDAPEGRPPEDEIRVMDCIDCHNRPAHIYRSPDRMVNLALQSGGLDRGLPAIKATAVDLLNAPYTTVVQAHDAIAVGLREQYLGDGAGVAPEAVDAAIEVVTSIYDENNFPEHGVDWRTYPDHIGHRAFPGCFRCHDDQHVSDDGQVISMDCSTCHEFVFQAHGEAAFGPVRYEARDWEHPEGEPYMHEGMPCTDCHSPVEEE